MKLLEKDLTMHEMPCGQNNLFPIIVSSCSFKRPGNTFEAHWHEHMEFLYVKSGTGIFECNRVPFHVKQGDLIVVNSGELHSGCSISKELSYYCFIMDPRLLQSSLLNISDIKYIAPIARNLILFNNRIKGDQEILNCIHAIIDEYEDKKIGYELSIISYFSRILVLLIRGHRAGTLSPLEFEGRKKDMERFSPVFRYIEDNYATRITGCELARLANTSLYYFSRVFKKITTMTITEYINSVRIRQAADLLVSTGLNITETALATGFNDVNYFTRQFKKHLGMSPSQFKAQSRDLKKPIETGAFGVDMAQIHMDGLEEAIEVLR